MRIQAVSLSSGTSRIVSDTLGGIRSELSNGNGTTEDILLFSEALFGRAPDDFLKRSTKGSLIHIAKNASGVVARFLAQKLPCAVEIGEVSSASGRNLYSTITAVVTDRPFIVDSIAELMRTRGIRHHVLLHPLLKTDGGTFLSLVYIEIDKIEDAESRKNLAVQITQVLNDVILATNDFVSLKERVTQVAEAVGAMSFSGSVSPERSELAAFLNWLADGGFVFLGYRQWRIEGKKLRKLEGDLGLFHSDNEELQGQLSETILDAEYLIELGSDYFFSKLNTISPIHRRTRLDLVTLQTTVDGAPTAICIVGLLTTKAHNQEAWTIPLIRNKVDSILQEEGFLPFSHDYKEILSLVNTMPIGDLLQFDRDTICEDLRIMMGIQRRSETKVIIRDHSAKRFFSISVFMPRDRFSSGAIQRIQRYIRRIISGNEHSVNYQVANTEDDLVAIFFLVENSTRAPLPVSVEEIERNIVELSLSWEEKLEVLLVREHGREIGLRLSALYNEIFPETYKAGVSHRESITDIQFLERLATEPMVLDLRQHPKQEDATLLKIYKKGSHLTLSELLPYLENVGFNVLNETVTRLSSSTQAQELSWGAIHTLRIRPKRNQSLDDSVVNRILLPGLRRLILKEADNDSLNGLLLTPGLEIREIGLLRALGHYLWQINESPSESAVAAALLDTPALALELIGAFRRKFELGDMSSTARSSAIVEIKKRFQSGLQQVTLLAHDRVLRALWNLVEGIVRTNFFCGDSLKIAFKVECAKLTRMPEPRPLFEIFISAPHFEGVHLRGGKVARGGLRWSERLDDFRTEIFGLMKTQMMKNAIIVPVGAKGGFIVKGPQPASRDQVVACYKDYIRSLLELTDNLSDGKIEPPKDVVRHDGDDPYLVVAADKGTAALSDVANEIATKEFNFWLGDAFASGGSAGYNHKSYAITARGVWETTKRHFCELGHDINSSTFSVIGIGDMSGDVFGNGLLLSDKARLIAAFDHRHIFLDPNPDPGSSYKERKRLFDLPSSSWKDYDKRVLSDGGSVYERAQKEIVLSDEIKRALGTEVSTVSGVELIRLILQAPVDLLWNGGIGTYVKSSSEHNVSVGDRANDEVRINADELRVKIVAEGGNLGFTQKSRLEFAALGGKINTDALDNSGGVNLSDLEVNIKVLLQPLVTSAALSYDARNRLLTEIAESVCSSVLKRNYSQSLAVSAGVIRSRRNLPYYRGVIDRFEQEGLLDRKLDHLPDDESLVERAELRTGLLRPELSILLACSKMKISDTVCNSTLPDDPALEPLLFEYFPEKLQHDYADQIRNHPLRKEIIATQVANQLGDRMGPTFLHRVVEEMGSSEESIIAAFIAAKRIIGDVRIVNSLLRYDTPSTSKRFLSAITRLNSVIDSVTRWILRGGVLGSKFGDISQTVGLYEQSYNELKNCIGDILPENELKNFDSALREFKSAGFSPDDAHEVNSFLYATALLDIIQLASQNKISQKQVGKLYAEVAVKLKTSELLQIVQKVEVREHWDITAHRTLDSTIRRIPGVVLKEIIDYPGTTLEERLRSFFFKHDKSLKHFLQNVKEVEGKSLSISALLVLSNQLTGFWRKA